MVFETWPLWAKITVYTYLIGGLLIYTLLSKIKVMGMDIIKDRDKLLISVFYPFAVLASLILIPILLLMLLFAPKKNKLIKVNISRMEKF